jgi:hypothetical protein
VIDGCGAYSPMMLLQEYVLPIRRCVRGDVALGQKLLWEKSTTREMTVGRRCCCREGLKRLHHPHRCR